MRWVDAVIMTIHNAISTVYTSPLILIRLTIWISVLVKLLRYFRYVLSPLYLRVLSGWRWSGGCMFLSFHCGSACDDVDDYIRQNGAINEALMLLDRLKGCMRPNIEKQIRSCRQQLQSYNWRNNWSQMNDWDELCKISVEQFQYH